jgi:hypothetical protein
MVMLWFRPQGVAPERLRRTASFGVIPRETQAESIGSVPPAGVLE